MISQTKKQHTSHLLHIQQTHRLHIHQLQSQHQKELDNIRHSIHPIDLEEMISKSLVDFEQEQHNHITSKPFAFDSQKIEKQLHYEIANQQWYSKKYMPVDAVTWPAPFPLSHLRKSPLQQIG
ncbi:hypothetical protein CU098_012586 [Rhizopus stolonifer]|uniref:Uncharacterized protein n=2 Tax=Mucorineae TaxID=1344963 RepID=A0A367KTF6_RHIST|nr:hypothetical protein CU098_012586 [Rhizopus stolonifer]